MSQNNHDTSLTNTLQDWRVSPTIEPQFRQKVLERIEAQNRDSGWAGYLQSHVAMAASLALMATLAGGVMGYAQAKEQANERREAMATAYVQSIDMSAMLAQR